MKINLLTSLFLALIGLLFFLTVTSALVNATIDLSRPVAKTYASDERIFLATYYFIKEGENYYQAFAKAVEQDARDKIMTADVFTWRLPTIFYLWSLTASNGEEILRNFLFLFFLALVCSYLLIKKISGHIIAFLAVIFLLPYAWDTLAYKTSFLFVEWWSWFFLIFGLTFFIYRNKALAWLFLFLAPATRELMIVPILSFFLYSLLRRKNIIFFLTIILVFACSYIFHSLAISSQSWITPQADLAARVHNFDKGTFLKMISFSARAYPLVAYKSHFLFLPLAFLSLVANIKANIFTPIAYYYLAGWSFVIILPFMTSSQYNDYWGILFMPTLIMSIPLCLNLLKPKI